MADLSVANSTYAIGTTDTASTLVNNVSPTDAAQYNGLSSAIIGIEGILGNALTLKGDLADLVSRLAVQILSDGIINPIGSMQMYAGASAPTGFLLCDGSAVSRATYANLFSIIGITYGPGDSATTFNLPDMRGRVAVGVGTGTGGAASGTGAPTGGSALTAVARGTWKGEETHTLTTAEMPAHAHTDSGHAHAQQGDTALTGAGGSWAGFGGAFGIGGSTGSSTANIQNTGGGGAHDNIQPVMGVNFIIKT